MAEAKLCRGCREVHDPLLRCEVARRRREAVPAPSISFAGGSRVTTDAAPAAKAAVVHVANEVVHASDAVVVNARTTDRHRKTPERRAYVAKKMRELRKRRAAGRVSG